MPRDKRKLLVDYKENRRLRQMVQELALIEEDLVPGLRRAKGEHLSDLSPWDRAKFECAEKLNKLRQELEDLTQMRASGTKNTESVRLAATCRRALKDCDNRINTMVKLWSTEWNTVKQASEKKRQSSAYAETLKRMKMRSKIQEAFRTQYIQLHLKLSQVPAEEQVEIVNRQQEKAKEKTEKVAEQLDNVPHKETRAERKARTKRAKRKKLQELDGQSNAYGNSDVQLEVMSDAQERAEAQIGLEREEQDRNLDAIGKAVTELGGIAEAIGEQIEKQSVYIQEIDDQMDSCQVKLTSATDQLKELNDAYDSAAMNWFCRLSCLLLLFAMGGYGYYLMTL